MAFTMALAASWGVPPAWSQARSPVRDQDQTIYDTLYREKLTSVERTRSSSDDLTLAQEMLAFAANLPESDTGVKCLAYLDVINLASNASNLGIMHEAMGLIQSLWPQQDALSSEQLLQLASRAYRGVDRSAKQEQGEHYVALLLMIATQYESDDDPEQAVGVCRLASTVARSIDSKQSQLIDQKLQHLADVTALSGKIKALTHSVQKNPQNSPAARELVNLLITRRNDAVAAEAFVDSTRDEELIDLVRHSAAGRDVASAAAAMRVADWYRTLAEEEEPRYALALLLASRQWYERFFSTYHRDDALAKRVREMDSLSQLKIQRLLESNPQLANADADGWISLIAPPFDFQKSVLGTADRLEVIDGNALLQEASLLIPFLKSDAYEIRLTVTIHEHAPDQRPALNLYLPVAQNRIMTTRYYTQGEKLARLTDLSERYLADPLAGPLNTRTQLTFQVVESEGKVAFAMLYNGQAAIKWQGEPQELPKLDEERLRDLPEDVGPMLLLRANAKLTIHAVDYRKRS